MTEANRGTDGYYHPVSEAELVALVKRAYTEGRRIRVRGAGHSCAPAIYTGGAGTDGIDLGAAAPERDDINVMLDRYVAIVSVDVDRRLVTVEAGIHLGDAPHDPVGTATLETSMLHQLDRDYSWSVDDLGGITHQTVSGFLSTGSAGGSLQHSIEENVHALRMIDGTGEIYEVSRDDLDPAGFHAVAISVGLLGIISQVTFRCVPTFNIEGTESITSIEECAFDLFSNDASPGKVGLATYCLDAEYMRFIWWPQRGAERVVSWQAHRVAPTPDFERKPYREFGDHPLRDELSIAVFLNFVGNLDDLSKARANLENDFENFTAMLRAAFERDRTSWFDKALAKAIGGIAEVGVDAALLILQPFAGRIKAKLPEIMRWAVGTFVPLDVEKKGAQQGQPQHFADVGWRGLPMDNQADDVFIATWFTELFLPLDRGAEALALLRDSFESAEDGHEALRRTGTFSWEMYAAKASDSWLSPSYTDGSDVWKDGCFRIDAFWYADDGGDPREFYGRCWRLLRDAGIPFRFHWGKFFPDVTADDPDGWVPFIREQHAMIPDFLALREQRDPNNVFLSDYWRGIFGLWDQGMPVPIG